MRPVRGYATSYTSRNSTIAGLASIVAGFAVLLTLLILFSRQLLMHLTDLSGPTGMIAVATFILLPAILLGLIIYQTAKLVRDRARRRPGALLKTRLILFFTTLVLLATVPQGLISINFIDLANNFWQDAGIEQSIDGATRLALDYYNQANRNLERFSHSRLLASFIEEAATRPDQAWREINLANPQIHFIQLFDDTGREVGFFFSGDERSAREIRLSSADQITREPMGIRKIDRRSVSFISNHITRTVRGRTYRLAVGTLLSPGFAETSAKLSEATAAFKQLDMFNRRISVVVAVVYFLFSLPIVLLALLISFFLTDELTHPIVSLEEATRRVAEGDFSFRILVRSNDELASLVNSFNRMVAELANSRRKLVHAEKISAWKEIARRLAHEIKNPLTPIKLSAQRILKRYADLPVTEGEQEVRAVLEHSVRAIVREVDALNELLNEFGDFARLPVPRKESVILRELIRETASSYGELSGSVTIDYSRVPADLTVPADPSQLRRVLTNLLHNALEAMPAGGSITLTADVVKKGETRYCRLQVRDTGCGMTDEVKNRAFMPYFTTKKGGTGLGLAIVERIVFDHNGEIWIETEPGSGATFFVDLPLEESAA